MTRTELKLLKDTLEEALRTDDGSGHWLPESHRSNMRKCIALVKRELKNHPEPAPKTVDLVEYDYDDNIPF